MKVLKTLVSSDDGVIYTIDTIQHEDGLWLVSEWLVSPTEGLRRPARIIRMDMLPHENAPSGFAQDYVLNGPIPKAVLDGTTPPQEAHGFLVIDRPDIVLPGGNSLH